LGQPAYRDRRVVESALAEAIGEELGCVVVTTDGEVHVFVVSTWAKKRAHELLAETSFPTCTVKQVSSRWSAMAMLAVREGLESALPFEAATGTAISVESPLEREDCPRVEITIPPVGVASERQEAWAAAMQARWGGDRVVVRRRHVALR